LRRVLKNEILKDFFAETKMSPIFAASLRGISSAGSEHLPYKQRVGGSNPSSPTTQKPVTKWPVFGL
jgi:hypothetical protein